MVGPLPTADRYVPNAAYAFDGVDDRIDVTDLSTWAFSNELSISFWVKAVESKGNLVVWAWPDIGSDRLMVSPHYFHTGSNDFNWTCGAYNGAGSCYFTGYTFAPGMGALRGNEQRCFQQHEGNTKRRALRLLSPRRRHPATLNRTLYIGGFWPPSSCTVHWMT